MAKVVILLSLPSLLLLCVGLGLGVYGAYSTQWLTAACNNTTIHVGIIRVCSEGVYDVTNCLWSVGDGVRLPGISCNIHLIVFVRAFDI